jgi:uncharacterized membrane protein HdeD (DUF308 family)
MFILEYLRYFFNPSHLFSLRPPLMTQRALMIVIILGVLCIITGIVGMICARRSRNGLMIKGYRKVTAFGWTMGIFAFLYAFFAYEGAIVLSGRFMILAWLIVAAIWKMYIIRYFWREVPSRRAELDQRKKYSKYIP